MADDELVSYWNDVHPPRPAAPPIMAADLDPPEPLPKKPPFCNRCGLPSRICDGSEHRAVESPEDLRRWTEEEKTLFFRKAPFLTEEEKILLRAKIRIFVPVPGESWQVVSEMKRDMIRGGAIPVPRWRFEMFRQVLLNRNRNYGDSGDDDE